MKKKPYLIDAVAGNSKMLAAYGKQGELLRLWWPHIDFPQHVDEILEGVYIGSGVNKLLWRNDGQWSYSQRYMDNTNIIQNSAEHESYKIQITSNEYCVPGMDILVRDFTIKNNSHKPLELTFLHYSCFSVAESDRYNTTYFNYDDDALMHYRHEYAFAIGSELNISGFTAAKGKEQCEKGSLSGVEIAMSKDAAISFELGEIMPGESVRVPIYITAAQKSHEDAFKLLQCAKEIGWEELLKRTVVYWEKYLEQAHDMRTGNKEIDELYIRSLLVFKLMSDERTGGLIAAPEFDEDFSKCGGYAFCWGRDAAYITTAICGAGYTDMGRNFYKWAVSSQESNGSWEHRHYMEGYMAPAWGMQIDETGSIVWGLWRYFEETKDRGFIEENWRSIKKAADFLLSFIDDETGLPRASMDLWEERSAQHAYSAAAVYGGLTGAAVLARELGHNQYAEIWTKSAESIQKTIDRDLWNEKKQSFYRALKLTISEEEYMKAVKNDEEVSLEITQKNYKKYIKKYDDIVDISLIGMSVPFGAVDACDNRMKKTAETIEGLLWQDKIGGIRRYEDCIYAGGNPWILTTLWLGLYHLETGNNEKALDMLKWAIEHRTSNNLLPEQVDKESGETAWVVPLTWSHAMLVLMVQELTRRGIKPE
jgi:glucoamylase